MTQVVLVALVCLATVGMYSAGRSAPELIYKAHRSVSQSRVLERVALKAGENRYRFVFQGANIDFFVRHPAL